MRIFSGLLAIAVLAAWGQVSPAATQCEPTTCSGAAKGKAVQKAKAAKPTAVKAKKPKAAYMKVAP